ncbi:MAG TPA: porin [Chitinophagales bacterium]|nr:porin [Chitinophagales bacterium]HRG26386.1 porin [Chitinophagales bacterium]HRG85387.1 porin [Chitinophagales bacterium]HRH51796.1 porin [Chitinophagales bacterium]
MKSTVLLLVVMLSLSVGMYAQSATQVETYNVKVSQKIELRGLTHVRYQLFEDSTKFDAFDLRRARLDFRGDIAPKVGYRLHTELAGTPKILDATFVYKPYEWLNVNVGQSKYPVCYDNLYSPWNLLTISRTQIDNSLSFRESDLYGNQNGRDIGLWLSGKYSIGSEEAKRPLLDYTLGIYNGSGINVADNNQDKDISAALGISPIKDLWIFGRFLNGIGRTTVQPTVDADRTRFGGNISYKYKSFIVEGEYLAASDESDSLALLERSGYYVTLGYTPIKDKLQIIARLDNYDPNTATEDNITNKYILAASYFFTKNTRIQLEYNLVLEEAETQKENNLFAIQFQAAF